jgi:hypothetical protein
MNKHVYIGWTNDDKTPRQIIGGPLTGWMFSDVVRHAKCPKCQSDPGYECESAKGRKVWPPHGDRIEAFQQMPIFKLENYMVKSFPDVRKLFEEKKPQ